MRFGGDLHEFVEQLTRRVLAVGERLGMPLHADDVVTVSALQSLDETVGRNRRNNQSVAHLTNALMMHAVNAQLSSPEDPGETRPFRDRDFMREIVAREMLAA